MAVHKISRLHQSFGDIPVTWDPEVTTEEGKAAIKEAEKIFKQARKEGFFAAAIDPDTKEGEVLTKFDPQAKNIVLYPQMAGG